jgi:glycosyltransferase involved in cell wall biosynthesis
VDVTVIVGTYGSAEWYEAGTRAVNAAAAWHAHPVLHVHAATLADARNRGATMADTEWLCFLDADDALAAGYFDAMAERALPETLLAPAVSYNGAPPQTFHDRTIAHLNPCVIGTLVERSLFHEAGGFYDEPIYEDWSLWLRCVRAGAAIRHVPGAVYLARINPAGRNSADAAMRRQWYRHIQRTYATLSA